MRQALALFFDFDNTITCGDVLDRVIERFCASDAWRGWEEDWQAGRLATPDCLALQVGDLRATREAMQEFVGQVEIDPGFARIVAWARARGDRVEVLSDNFRPLITPLLAREGLDALPLFCNEMESDGEHHRARFPLRDPACARCAHCKAGHVRAAKGRALRIFVGDGLSDVCGAVESDGVFAKDSLARALQSRGVAFTRYGDLDDVLDSLRAQFPTS